MPDASYLTIGKVVEKLQASYPDLTVSKVRFLEDEGIVAPSRTSSGYRMFSPADVKRLDTALHLQKTRFLPLSIIRDELERIEKEGASSASSAEVGVDVATMNVDPDDVVSRLHPIDRMPEVAGVSVSFVRSLHEAGLIEFKRSPHGRDLVDGRDLALIRTCDELRHFGFEPKNLRQYVNSANRESATFEQALVVYARKGGGVELERTEEARAQFDQAFSRMLSLTNAIRTILIKRRVQNPFASMEDAK